MRAIKIFLSAGLAASGIFASCSTTGQEIIYRHSFYYSEKSENTRISGQSIDRGKTHEIFVLLKGETDCVRISFSSETPPHPLTGETGNIYTFFEVDKLVDITRFGTGKKYTFSPVAKNYDRNWEPHPAADACEETIKPIGRFTENTLLRIRFTGFSHDSFRYQIKVEADCAVDFLEELPESKTFRPPSENISAFNFLFL